MKSHSVSVPLHGRSAAPAVHRHAPSGDTGCHCGCGCEPADCCRLECLVRPRFFCGQLLTDQDLGALVGWAQARFALSRYVDGWGVACGLQVTCHGHVGAEVAVGPGYAVDCCGRDVVVCEPAIVDLSAACEEPEEPCADLEAYARRRDAGRDARRVHVDLAIRHAESGTDPQTALGRGSCGQASVCEPTRLREGHELVWSEAVPGRSPADAAWQRWNRAWECCCEVLDRFEERFGGSVGSSAEDAVRRWLLQWIDDHPPGQLCFLRDWICRDDDDRPLVPRLPAILFLLVQDCRNAVAACGCLPSEADAAVPLARVCLEAGPRGKCRVVAIDPYPPFRRPLARDCWPAPLGQVNLARAQWQRPEEACRLLADLGVRVRPGGKARPLPDGFEALRELCKQPPPLAGCGDEICLQVVEGLDELCLDGPRVVGFAPCPADEPPPVEEPRPVAVSIQKVGPQQISVGTTSLEYRLRFRCSNPNPFPVRLRLFDDMPEQASYLKDDAGVPALHLDEHRVGWEFTVPANRALDGDWSLAVALARLAPTAVLENRATLEVTGPGDELLGSAAATPVRTTVHRERPTPVDPIDSPPQPPVRPIDDLTVIHGIGDSRRRVLAEAGIRTFAELAQARPETILELFPSAGKPAIDRWRDVARERAGEDA